MNKPEFHRWEWAWHYANHMAYVLGKRFRVMKLDGMWEVVPAKKGV